MSGALKYFLHLLLNHWRFRQKSQCQVTTKIGQTTVSGLKHPQTWYIGLLFFNHSCVVETMKTLGGRTLWFLTVMGTSLDFSKALPLTEGIFKVKAALLTCCTWYVWVTMQVRCVHAFSVPCRYTGCNKQASGWWGDPAFDWLISFSTGLVLIVFTFLFATNIRISIFETFLGLAC